MTCVYVDPKSGEKCGRWETHAFHDPNTMKLVDGVSAYHPFKPANRVASPELRDAPYRKPAPSPTDRAASEGKVAPPGSYTCKSCGYKWILSLNPQTDACPACMTPPMAKATPKPVAPEPCQVEQRIAERIPSLIWNREKAELMSDAEVRNGLICLAEAVRDISEWITKPAKEKP